MTFLVLIGTFLLISGEPEFAVPKLLGLGISLKGGEMQGVLATLTAFIWFMTTVFSKEYFADYKNRNRYYFFMQMTLGATLGVFLSADFYTTFIFFEIMSFTSFVLVIHDQTKRATDAALTYLTVAIVGGLVTLAGLAMAYSMAGTLDMTALGEYAQGLVGEEKTQFYIVGALILTGFAAKAGLFPMHIWLPEAHPVAPAPASAILSCILTKTGVFGIIVLSTKVFLYDAAWGNMILILGTITMLLGAVLAVFSVDLKRTMACSSLSQIGFITVAIAMQCILGSHNALAAGGTTLHIVNHSLLKLVLFMSAGVIYINTHKLNLNEIRGWGYDKPLLNTVFLAAVLGITGVPFFNGYISKTLIHESIVEQIVFLEEAGLRAGNMKLVEYIFLFSGGLTVAYMAKIYIAVFTKSKKPMHHHEKKPYITKLSAVVLAVAAIILPILGIFPHQTAEKIAELCYHFMNAHSPDHAVEYLAWVNLKGAVISISVGAVVYFGFIKTMLMDKEGNYFDCWPSWLSLEKLVYRPLILGFFPYFLGFFARLLGTFTDGVVALLRVFIFNNDYGRVVPPEDKYFSTYNEDGTERVEYEEGFARSLLFIGIGLAVAMIYILI